MRLTDEERRIADRVAERMAEENDADDAWGHAMLYIAARREAFGEAEPAPATVAGVGSYEVEVRVGQGDDGTGVPLTARIVRPPADAGVGDDVKAADQLQPGDYVLATKFHDGDPGDHFVVGYIGNPPESGHSRDRWRVVNDEGTPFRASGFRRAEKITQDEGQAILAIMPKIANVDGPSLWEHLARIRREKVESPATAAGVGALPPEASGEAVAWYVEGGIGDPMRAWEYHCNAARVARVCGGTVVPLVRKCEQGVRVTEDQQDALAVAEIVLRRGGDSATADGLRSLLAAIAAAKGDES